MTPTRSAPYVEDVEAAARILVLARAVDPRRWQTFFIRTHRRGGDEGDEGATETPRAALASYVASLGLGAMSLPQMTMATRGRALQVVMESLESDLVMRNRQLPREVAAPIADLWLARWSPACSFFTNVPSAVTLPLPPLGWAPGGMLFGTDLELGVIAVDRDQAGIFYARESS